MQPTRNSLMAATDPQSSALHCCLSLRLLALQVSFPAAKRDPCIWAACLVSDAKPESTPKLTRCPGPAVACRGETGAQQRSFPWAPWDSEIQHSPGVTPLGIATPSFVPLPASCDDLACTLGLECRVVWQGQWSCSVGLSVGMEPVCICVNNTVAPAITT